MDYAHEIVEFGTNILDLGGPVVLILICFSIGSITIALIKFWQLYLLRLPLKLTKSVPLVQVESDVLMLSDSLVSGRNNLYTHTLSETLRLFKNPALSSGDIKTESTRIARAAITQLAGYLRPLEVIATLAPLLGLFGTVLGMIEAFQAMEAAGSQINPGVLSSGIWQALLTTAVGLAVAIPTALAHSWLERQVERHAFTVQDTLEHLFTLKAGLDGDPAQQAGRA